MISQPIKVLTSAVLTASGAQDVGAMPAEYMEALVYVDVTAASGTSPSLTLTYQVSHNGTDWFDHTAGAAITAVAKQLIKIPSNAGRYARIKYDITGTSPSFTLSVVVEGKRGRP